MKTLKIKKTLVMDLKRDDIIEEKLNEFIKENNIKHATYDGIGAARCLVIGILINENPLKYKKITCEGKYELLSFKGNIRDGKSHTHIVLANNIANSIGGHFFSGVCNYVLQVYFNVYE